MSESQPKAAEATGRLRHPFLVYSGLRVLLLLVALGVCYLLGARDLVLIVLAFVLSGVASYFLLNRSRGQVSESISGYFRRLNARIDSSAASEEHVFDTDAAGPSGDDDGATSVDISAPRPSQQVRD